MSRRRARRTSCASCHRHGHTPVLPAPVSFVASQLNAPRFDRSSSSWTSVEPRRETGTCSRTSCTALKFQVCEQQMDADGDYKALDANRPAPVSVPPCLSVGRLWSAPEQSDARRRAGASNTVSCRTAAPSTVRPNRSTVSETSSDVTSSLKRRNSVRPVAFTSALTSVGGVVSCPTAGAAIPTTATAKAATTAARICAPFSTVSTRKQS